jgi:hypothetical protein
MVPSPSCVSTSDKNTQMLSHLAHRYVRMTRMAKQRREYPDPGPKPENPTPEELEKWRIANEKFLMEGGQKLPAGRPKIDHTDERIKIMRRDHVKFLERINPFTDALWLALLRDEGATLLDEELSLRYQRAIAGGSATVADAPHRPTIVGIANQLAARALRGDMAAIAQIAERIEGKAGLRRGDIDPDDPVRERKTRAIVEDTVRALTDKRIKEREEEAIDVKVKVVVPESREAKIEAPIIRRAES